MKAQNNASVPDDNALAAFLRIGSIIGVLDECELYPSLLDAVFELIPAKRGAIIFATGDGERFASGIYRERGRDIDAPFVPGSNHVRRSVDRNTIYQQ
jgi:hypothetical protein